MIMRVLILCAASVVLAGCATTGVGSVKGGECRLFERPQYAVKGLRRYDQDWIDGNIEAGVGGCGWKRPAARPASLDGKLPAVVKRKPPRKSIIRRIKDKIIPKAVAKPIEPVPYIAPVAPPPSPPKPRDPVDELLGIK